VAEGENQEVPPSREVASYSLHSSALNEIAIIAEGLLWIVNCIAILVGLSILLSMVGMAAYILISYG